jgi:hypothetical protein
MRVVSLRERPYAYILALVLVGLAVPFVTRSRTEWDTVYVATTADLLAGRDIYDQPNGFSYPPFQAVFALPVIGLAKPAQRAVWFTVNAIALVVLLRSAWRLAEGGTLRLGRDHAEHVACWLGLAVGVGFAFNSLSHQQTDIVLGALVVVGISRLARGQSLVAATWFGFAAAMKCTPLLFAPYLVMRRKPVAAAWLVAVAAAASSTPDLVVRPTTDGTWLGRWYAHLLRPITRPEFTPGIWASDIIYNQSLVGAMNRWTRTTWEPAGKFALIRDVPATATPAELRRWMLAAAGVCGAIGLAAIVVARRRPLVAEPLATCCEGGIVITGMLLFSPMSSPAHFGLLLLPGFALARTAVVSRKAWAWPLLLAALLGALLINKDLWGDKLYTLGLWYGSATGATVAMLLGCVIGLVTSRAETFTESTQIPEPACKKVAA